MAKRIMVCGVTGALLGSALSFALQGTERLVAGAASGLLIGAICGVLDRLMSDALAWAVCRTQKRMLVAMAGAAINAGLMSGLTLLMLAAIGWVGNCWG